MAKLRHLAIATNDPDKTAEFFKEAFGLREVSPIDGDLAKGHFLTDGTVTFAILKFKTQQGDKSPDYVGIHHMGFVVEDLEETGKKLEDLGAPCFMPKPANPKPGNFFEVKHSTPEGIIIDISDHAWPGGMGLEDAPLATAKA